MCKADENEFGQPIGVSLGSWIPPVFPPHVVIEGDHVRLEPLDLNQHGNALYEAWHQHSPESTWTYLAIGPFPDRESFMHWWNEKVQSPDPQYYAIVIKETGAVAGVASYMRIKPESGSIEVGHIHYSTVLQKTIAATEAMYLMMQNVFNLGYRRYEWKCDSLNAPSRAAALRLGFQYEGIFRQATCYKGRNRDTAWFSIIDLDWPVLNEAYQLWLHADNFDENGKQKARLEDCLKQ